MTNGDRIRAMTDEELAEFLSEVKNYCIKIPCGKCYFYDAESSVDDIRCNPLRWLKQEVAKMPELIDREATLKKMCETCGYCERLEKAMRSTHPDFVTDKCNAYKFLAEQPTISPEVRHGRWIDNESRCYPYKCTSCNTSADWHYKFCPYCGSKNEGD